MIPTTWTGIPFPSRRHPTSPLQGACWSSIRPETVATARGKKSPLPPTATVSLPSVLSTHQGSTPPLAVMAPAPMAASNPTSVPQGKTPSTSIPTARFARATARLLLLPSFVVPPPACGAPTPSLQRWTSGGALLESAHQWNAPDTVCGYGIPDLWKAHLLLGGRAPRETENLLVYPNPVGASARILHVVFEEENLRSASGTPLTWSISGRLGAHRLGRPH